MHKHNGVLKMSRSNHITTGDVFDDLGFSKSEASALKIKASILEAILAEIDRRGLTQRDLVEVLDEYQPNVSNLLHGRISKVSIEKLLCYADRLSMQSKIELRPPARSSRVQSTKGTVAKDPIYA
jgi:predicted XRE-type DNA-binding protein|uniref:XRE family transcriptional regulator n=1 Tax=Acidobacterium capsulatum TaxID=33075 RepID=A0A7V4XS91_9BACT